MIDIFAKWKDGELVCVPKKEEECREQSISEPLRSVFDLTKPHSPPFLLDSFFRFLV